MLVNTLLPLWLVREEHTTLAVDPLVEQVRVETVERSIPQPPPWHPSGALGMEPFKVWFFGEFRGTVWRIPDRRWLRLGGWKH